MPRSRALLLNPPSRRPPAAGGPGYTIRRCQTSAVEVLEQRRLLSAATAGPSAPASGAAAPIAHPLAVSLAATTSPGNGLTPVGGGLSVSKATLHLTDGRPFQGEVGVVGGVPNPSAALSRLRAVIDWGDGSPSTAGTLTVSRIGTLHIAGGHTYGLAGTLFATVSLYQVPPASAGGTPAPAHLVDLVTKVILPGVSGNSDGGVTVHAVATQPFAGELATFPYPIVHPTTYPLPVRVAIDWGDGTASAGKLNENGQGGYDVTAAHTYAAPGTFRIHMVVTRNAAGSTTVVRQIDSTAIVTAAALPPAPTRTA